MLWRACMRPLRAVPSAAAGSHYYAAVCRQLPLRPCCLTRPAAPITRRRAAAAGLRPSQLAASSSRRVLAVRPAAAAAAKAGDYVKVLPAAADSPTATTTIRQQLLHWGCACMARLCAPGNPAPHARAACMHALPIRLTTPARWMTAPSLTPVARKGAHRWSLRSAAAWWAQAVAWRAMHHA